MRIMKKIITCLLLLTVVFGLAGCIQKENTEEEPSYPTLSFDEEVYTIIEGGSVILSPSIGNSEEILEVEYQVTDQSVVHVENSKATGTAPGTTEVTAFIKQFPNIQVVITIHVLPGQSEPIPEELAHEKIESIKALLDETIPSIVTDNIQMPRNFDNYSVMVTWSSSNLDAINTAGRVQRSDTRDQKVDLSAIIYYNGFEGEFMKTVTVKKYTLRSLTDRRLAFAYLFDSTYKPIRTEDLATIDVINYSFGWISGGSVSVSHLSHLSTTVNLAHNYGVRVVLAIGGWGGGGFSEAAANEQTRASFVQSVMRTIRDNHLDGIDIDWEYPTSTVAGIAASPEDRDNLTLLAQELRTAMDSVNPDLILSIAVAGGAYAVGSFYDVRKLNDYIDYFNIMSYDLVDYTGGLTSHHTNLYYSSNANGSADAAIRAYIAGGADPMKVMLGIAFYGHIGKVTEQTSNGMRARNEGLSGAVSYTKIYNDYLTNPAFVRYYDEAAQAPWLFDGTTFITYDDPTSIAAKCLYASENNLGGVMFWDLNQDTTGTLVSAISENLNK